MKANETTARAQGLTRAKSSYSGAEGGQCLEVRSTIGMVHVRDLKDKAGPTPTFEPDAWNAFLCFAARVDV